MKIEFFSLKRQIRGIDKQILAAFNSVLEKGNFILSEQVGCFEREFAKFVGSRYAVGVASGTDALLLSLLALGIGKGDEVITVPNTAVATAAAIQLAGARPVFVDVGEDYLIDVRKIEKVISKKTKAIIPVYLYGLCCDMKEIIKIAQGHKLYLIEDCAQAHGATYCGKYAGSLGTAGCFSFYPTKNLGAYGDGGLITINDNKIYRRILLLRNYGWSKRYVSEIKGLNSRLDELQAAFLRVKLNKLRAWNNRRREIANLYKKYIMPESCLLPIEGYKKYHVYHMFVVRVKKRQALVGYLRNKRGIGVSVHYPTPIHLQKAYQDLGYREGDFPVAEKLSQQILSLPVYPELTNNEIVYVADAINTFYGK